jgi:hypothetical protein
MLDTPGEDGVTQRDHLLGIAKIPGAPRPPELDLPTSPPGMFLYVWAVFFKLSATRSWSGNHPLAITYQEIAAYCSLYGEQLSKYDLDVIRTLDGTWINATVQASQR